jgi:hypoxanthine phosphoribosyltransferase
VHFRPGSGNRIQLERDQPSTRQERAAKVGPVEAALAKGGGPVLLVDDRVDTGWTMTFAAKLLRGCGAPAVLRFALAVTN